VAVWSKLLTSTCQLLHELLPAADTIAFLVNPGNVNIKIDEPEIRAAADRLKQHLEVLTASTERDLEAAFATMVQRGVGGLIVKPDPFFISRSAARARRSRSRCHPTP
jgi:putative ABC transport system substrate-binding protein